MHVITHLFAYCSVTNELPEDIKKNHNANLQTKVSNIVVMWDNSDGGNGREKRCDHNLNAEKQQ